VHRRLNSHSSSSQSIMADQVITIFPLPLSLFFPRASVSTLPFPLLTFFFEVGGLG